MRWIKTPPPHPKGSTGSSSDAHVSIFGRGCVRPFGQIWASAASAAAEQTPWKVTSHAKWGWGRGIENERRIMILPTDPSWGLYPELLQIDRSLDYRFRTFGIQHDWFMRLSYCGGGRGHAYLWNALPCASHILHLCARQSTEKHQQHCNREVLCMFYVLRRVPLGTWEPIVHCHSKLCKCLQYEPLIAIIGCKNLAFLWMNRQRKTTRKHRKWQQPCNSHRSQIAKIRLPLKSAPWRWCAHTAAPR